MLIFRFNYKQTNAAKQESILEKKIQAVDELKMIHQTVNQIFNI